MLSNFRFSRGGVSRVLGISVLIATLFVVGCSTNGSAQFAVTTTSGQLATVVVNAAYPATTMAASNGTAPYTWAVTSGALPTGLTLSSGGVLSGTPTASGTFNFIVTVTDSATPAHTASANLSVSINPGLASVTLNPTTVAGGTSSTGTLTLNGAAAAAATVTLSSNSSSATVPATATVAAGSTTGTFQVTTTGVTTSTSATITATFGAAKTANLTIIPPTVSMVTLAQSTLTGGAGTTGTVTLSGPAAAGGDVVTLSSTNAAATPQATVTVLAGAATAQFNVTTGAVVASTTGNIQASFNSTSQTAALTVVPAPSITSFTAAATSISSGSSTTLTGIFTNGTGSVSNGVGAVVSGTAATVAPTATTTYTLTVTNAAGTTVTKQATVNVVAAPTITSFVAAAPTITAGTSTTLTGVFSNGTGSVDNSVGAVTSGTAVTVSPASTTTYTLTVKNSAGATVTKQATVTVVAAPAITSFTSAAATITAGTSTTLTGVFSNGTGSVNNGVGAVTSGIAVTVSPAATTTYTLTVTNTANTSVTKQVTVTVVAAPVITSFSAAAATITAGTSTTLTGIFSNGTGSVDTGVGAVNSGTAVPVSPASTTTYTLTVTNSGGATVTKQATVTVVPAPVITSFTPGASTIVSGSSTTLTAVFPNGTGSINNGVGAVTSGTPVNISPTSTTTYTLTVTNAATTPATVTATTTVTVHAPPAFTSANNTTFIVGSNGTFTVKTTGSPVAALNFTGSLPPGSVTFHDNGDGTATISGTPTGSPASYPIQITANNGVPPSAVQTLTINVVLVQAPAITSANSVTFTAGTSGTFTVTTTGSPTPALTKTGSLPASVNFTDNGNGTATISGIPAAVGSTPITITANNGVGSNAQQPFTLNVVAAPAITSFSAASTTITAGSSTTLTGTFSGGTGSVNNSVGAVTSGTPASVSPSVTTTYTLTVTNAATTPVSVTATATVTVVAAPVITSFTATPTTIVSGSSTTLTPVFSNGTGSVDHGVGAVTSGTGVTVSPTTTTTYTLTVTNGAGTKTTSTVTITVDSAPTITSANSAGFTAGTAGSFNVTTTGFPVPALSETLALPTGVSFHDNGNGTGTLSWTAAVANGSYSLSFTASNSVLPNATQSFTLTADAAPAITSANSTTFTAGAAGSFNVTTTGFPTPALSETLALPTGVSFVDNHNGTGTLSWTAAVSGGSYGLSFTASNGIGSNATQSFTLTVDAAPTITSANSANATAGVAGSFTVTTTGFPTPALGETLALPTGVSFHDNGNGTGTLSWTTAIALGTDSLSFTASNGIGTNATQPFTLNVAVASCTTTCQISGTISGPWIQNVSVAITGPTNINVTTDVNGNYTTPATMKNGSYTITPNTVAPVLQGYNFAPTSITGLSVNSVTTGQNFTETSQVASFSISGMVSYSGAQTGKTLNTLINVFQCSSCNNPQGGTTLTTVPTAGGTFYTIRGLPSGNYSVNAEIDVQGTGAYNASNPEGAYIGNGGTVNLTSSSATGINFSLADRAAPSGSSLVAPTLNGVAPSSGTAFIIYNPSQNSFSEDVATSYKIYYGTDTAASNLGSITIPAGNQQDVYVLPGLTNGIPYYFQMSAVNSSGESAKAPATPLSATIGNSTAGANSISGTITYTGITPTGSLIVGVYSNNNGVYYQRIASPAAGSQAYTISGIPSGGYQLFVVLDQNHNGYIDAGDVTNFVGANGPPPVTVPVTGAQNVTLTAANATTFVSTQHTLNGGTHTYGINVGENMGAKLPISMTLFSGPNAAVPFDMSASSSNNNNFQPVFNNSVSPTAGDLYQFLVTYSDGTTQILSSSVSAVLTSFPQNLAVQTTTPGTPFIPLFTWSAPASAPPFYTYQVDVSQANGPGAWHYPQHSSGAPSTTTSVLYGTGGNANPSSLQAGVTYDWSVRDTDANGNYAQLVTTYTVAGTPLPTVAPYFVSSSIPVNGSTTLIFNITNPSSSTGMSGIAFTDNMTGGLSMTGTIQFNSCSGSVVETTSTVLNYSGGSLAAGASCNFAVNVTDTAVETNTNTATNITDTGNTTGTTSSNATLTVFSGVGAPVVNAYFTSPGSILVGQTTTLNFNIYNNNGGSVTLNSIGFTDSFAGSSLLITQVSGTTIAFNNCSGTVTATNGTNSLSLSGASLPAGSSCTFGVNVTDSTPETVNTTPTGVTSSPSGIGGGGTTATLTVSGGTAPSITTSNAANFFVGLQETFDVQATGNPTPALAVTGALPTGLSFTDNGNGSGVLHGTPGAGTAGSYTPLVTASNGVSPNATQNLTLTVTSLQCPLTSLGNESLLNGTYVSLFNGFKDADGPSQGAMVFVANGTGGITNGELDFGTVLNYNGTSYTTPIAPQNASISSTGSCYNLGSDGRGTMVWNISAGTPLTREFSLRGDGALGRFIDFSDVNPSLTSTGSRGSAVFMKRTISGPFNLSSLNGSFAIGLSGFNNDNCTSSSCTGSGNGGYQRIASVGRFTSNGAGTLSGFVFSVADVNSSVQTNADLITPTSASYTAPDSLGRGTLTISGNDARIGGAFTVDFVYYLIDATHVYLQSIDSPANNPLFNGEAIGQTGSFSVATLNGNAVFSVTGGDVVNNSYTVIAAGRVTGVGTGSNVSTLLDKISNGAAVSTGTTAITGGTFAASANGMGTLTIGSGGSAKAFSVAMIGTNSGFIIEGTQASPGTNVMSGLLEPQTAPGGGWTNSAASGLYIEANVFPSVTNAKVEVSSITFTPGSPSGTLSGTSDKSTGLPCANSCLTLNKSISDTYSIDFNGRITLSTGSNALVGWLRDTTHFAVLSPNSIGLITQLDH